VRHAIFLNSTPMAAASVGTRSTPAGAVLAAIINGVGRHVWTARAGRCM